MTSSNIPDGISFSDLQSMLGDAPREDNVSNQEGPLLGMTAEDFRKSVLDAQEKVHDSFSHPMTAKLLIMENLFALMKWHTDRGRDEFESGDDDCGTAWLRDAGKLQACMQLVTSVQLPDDFICDHKK